MAIAKQADADSRRLRRGARARSIPATPASRPGSRPPATSSTRSRGAPARRVAELSQGLERYRAGQTGLLRLTWDNGDRTVLVNPELGGVTLGWNLTHTAQDELFAAIEGTAFHTRVILERMEEHGVPIRRVINGGGIPQKNDVLNQVYANVLEQADAGAERRCHQPRLGDLRVPGGRRVQDHRRSAGRAVPALRDDRARAAAAPPSTTSCIRSTGKLYFAFGQRGSPSVRDRRCAARAARASRRSAEEDHECWKRCELKFWKPISNWSAADW